MLNNAAEIVSINLDNKTLLEEWDKFLPTIIDKLKKQPDSFNSLNFNLFTEYFQNIFIEIINHLDVQTDTAAVFYHDYPQHKTKVEYTSAVHMDYDRKSAISIPIVTSDPLLFFDYDEQYDNDRTGKKLRNLKKPNQVLHYKTDHPTLINTRNLHSVFVLDETTPRILIQINCYESFDSIIERNKSKLRLV